MTTYNVGYIVGSLAKASINRKLAKALIRVAPEKLQKAVGSFPADKVAGVVFNEIP